jgi:E3 Ubiquitin ligase
MLVSLRREYAHLVTSGTQLLLLLIGFKLESRNGWLICLSIMAAISILAWLSALNRLRAIRDTPTSNVASAAQGYVELIGRGQPFGETPLLGKLSLLPCLWYRYKIEQRDSEKDWRTIDTGESDDSFLLRDQTGECVVDPEQAEILTQHCDQWHEGDRRYTEWKLIEQDRLYVIGQFRTQGGGSLEFDTRAELNTLLAEWKKDMPALHTRFDLDNNGTLDMQEWMLARSSAKREVTKMMREAQAQPDIHIISQPRDGKLFLISNLMPDKLSRRFLFWSWAHLMIFFGALGGIGWLLQSANF